MSLRLCCFSVDKIFLYIAVCWKCFGICSSWIKGCCFSKDIVLGTVKYDTKVWSPISETPCTKDQSISFLWNLSSFLKFMLDTFKSKGFVRRLKKSHAIKRWRKHAGMVASQRSLVPNEQQRDNTPVNSILRSVRYETTRDQPNGYPCCNPIEETTRENTTLTSFAVSRSTSTYPCTTVRPVPLARLSFRECVLPRKDSLPL